MKRAIFHNSGDEICMVVVVLDTIEMNVWLLIGRIYRGDGDGGGVSDSIYFVWVGGGGMETDYRETDF